MALKLDDSWTKLARGKEHLDTLALECEEYLLAGPVFTAEVFYDPEAGTVEPEFRADPTPPPRIGAIVGDVAHNLRSALDVAAWQLAIANDEDAARAEQFNVLHQTVSPPATASRKMYSSERSRTTCGGAILQPTASMRRCCAWPRCVAS